MITVESETSKFGYMKPAEYDMYDVSKHFLIIIILVLILYISLLL